MQSKYAGYMGKVVMVDLTTESISEYPWSDEQRELYLGGKIMAARILCDHLTGIRPNVRIPYFAMICFAKGVVPTIPTESEPNSTPISSWNFPVIYRLGASGFLFCAEYG